MALRVRLVRHGAGMNGVQHWHHVCWFCGTDVCGRLSIAGDTNSRAPAGMPNWYRCACGCVEGPASDTPGRAYSPGWPYPDYDPEFAARASSPALEDLC